MQNMAQTPHQPAAGAQPCPHCRHHFVTYDANMPHGCHLFGIRTRRMPNMVVRDESGQDCTQFEARPQPKPR